MIKTVEIKMNLLHKNIVEVLSEGETIGFIVNTDNKENRTPSLLLAGVMLVILIARNVPLMLRCVRILT